MYDQYADRMKNFGKTKIVHSRSKLLRKSNQVKIKTKVIDRK